jgi:YHS domain-containing protein
MAYTRSEPRQDALSFCAWCRSRRLRLVLVGLAALLLVVVAVVIRVAVRPAQEVTSLWNSTDMAVALGGYDTVAYFTVGKPLKGSPKYKHRWAGATWFFANKGHLNKFVDEPELYVPQFGGFCAAAMTFGAMARADPEVWTIVDGKLYLNFDKYARGVFRENLEQNVEKAEKQWAVKLEDWQKNNKTSK